jgi:hypothetical protein
MKGLAKNRHCFFDPFFDFFCQNCHSRSIYLRVSFFEKERTNAINNEIGIA